jgi:glycosyltransferase involved in cell wall biosynthesis
MVERHPKVTVGLPVYNGEKYVREAIESVLSQTYGDFELFISDNCSTDRTAEICAEYARRDSRIRYFRQPRNLGACPNHNWLVHHARGEYYIRLASDDRHGSRLLELCSQVLDHHPDVVVAYPRMIDIDADGMEIGPNGENCHLMDDAPHLRFALCLQRMVYINACLGLVRTEQLRKTCLLRPYRSSDHALQAELTLLGKFYEVPEEMYFRRVHPDSSLAKNRDYVSINRWFDTSYRGGRMHHLRDINLGFCRAVLRHPEIGLVSQLRCLCSILPLAWRDFHCWAALRTRLLRLLKLEKIG